jgi:hypothetical protein
MFHKPHAPSTRIHSNKQFDTKFSQWITYFSNFSRRQNVLLIVRSQYRYWVISKTFQPSKAITKIYILSCVHIWFKINMSLNKKARALPKGANSPPPGRTPHIGNLRSRSNWLTAWSRVLLHKLIVAQEHKLFPTFGTSPRFPPQDIILRHTNPVHSLTPYYFKIRFNIIFPPMLWPRKRPFRLSFHTKHLFAVLNPMHATCSSK